MGAWGEGPFDNDDASDFVGDLSDGAAADAPHVLAAVLGQVVGVDGYVEAPEMSRALAAAAIVALSVERTVPPPQSLTGDWIAAVPVASPVLVGAAAAVFERAFDGVDNEWFALWKEADLLEEARTRLAPYVAALKTAGGA